MAVIDSTALHDPSAGSSVNQPPSALAEPLTSPNLDGVVMPNPPKITTPQRTRRQETPTPTTATRLRSHITPTKWADAGMLRAQEMRLALLPPAQPQQPAEPSIDSTHSSVQPESVPPTIRVIPPTPLQRSGGAFCNDVNYAESRGGRYPSPGDSRQGSIYPGGRPVYNMRMLPVQDHHNNLIYNHPNDGYRRSPTESCEGSVPLYQHPAGYAETYRLPHTRPSLRIDYAALPGPSRYPLHHPNQYSYGERPIQPSERGSPFTPMIEMERAQRTRSPPASGVLQSDRAHDM